MNFSSTIKVHGCRLLLGVTTALAVAWLIEPMFLSSWMLRLALLGGLLAVTSALFRLEVKKQMAAERTAKRFMDVLCQLELHELGNSQGIESLPPVGKDNPWRPMLERVRDRLITCGERAEESEHARTATEVRARRLENECSRIKQILDRISDSIVAVNQYDEIVWSNEPARNWFAIRPTTETALKVGDAVQNKTLIDLLTDARRRKVASSRTGEIELVDRSGQPRWFRVACRALSPSDGDTSGQHGALAVLTDISQEKGIQKRHAEFVAAASHEMKTPLSSIRAYVELLQDGEAEDPTIRDEFLGVIQSQAERLQRLIENLLNLARIEAGVVKVDKKQLSLNELLEQAFNVVQPTAEQKPIELTRDLSPMFLGVLGDRDMILQATINLLSNAVKYTRPGGKVILRSRMEENAAMLEVEDSGVGLSPEDCQKIFEKFYRVKKDEQMAPGTGLGLPMVKHIVEDVHGGSVTVTSQPGVGSIFRVTLPVVGRGKD